MISKEQLLNKRQVPGQAVSLLDLHTIAQISLLRSILLQNSL